MFLSSMNTHIYTSTLSLHDALPILRQHGQHGRGEPGRHPGDERPPAVPQHQVEQQQPGERLERGRESDPYAGAYVAPRDRKSTRLNSSHRCISYAVFCLKKKTLTSW